MNCTFTKFIIFNSLRFTHATIVAVEAKFLYLAIVVFETLDGNACVHCVVLFCLEKLSLIEVLKILFIIPKWTK